MRVVSIHHVPFEGLGSIQDLISGNRHTLETINMWTYPEFPDIGQVDLLIIMGGPMGVSDQSTYPWLAGEKAYIRSAIKSGTKILGICLGAQLIAEALGAEVTAGPQREIGWYPVTRSPRVRDSGIGGVFPERFTAFHWHGDAFTCPDTAVPLAESPACPCQAFSFEDRIIALQFHLETTRQSATELVAHGSGDLAQSGPFVQDSKTILETNAPFEQLRPLMEGVWSFLTD